MDSSWPTACSKKPFPRAGKVDFYLNLLNEKERVPDDNPSIGIILCAE